MREDKRIINTSEPGKKLANYLLIETQSHELKHKCPEHEKTKCTIEKEKSK